MIMMLMKSNTFEFEKLPNVIDEEVKESFFKGELKGI